MKNAKEVVTIPLRFKIIEKEEKISSCLEGISGISGGVLAHLFLGISVHKRGIPFLKQRKLTNKVRIVLLFLKSMCTPNGRYDDVREYASQSTHGTDPFLCLRQQRIVANYV